MNNELLDVLSYDPITGIFRWSRHVGRKCRAGTIAGCASREKGYVNIIYKRKKYQAHRLAWYFVYGVMPPPEVVVDHINCDGFDNRIVNLRLASTGENLRNTGHKKNNKLGIKGVRFHSGSFRAEITANYVKHYLGSFSTADEAAAAYWQAAEVLHGEFARAHGQSHRSRHGK